MSKEQQQLLRELFLHPQLGPVVISNLDGKHRPKDLLRCRLVEEAFRDRVDSHIIEVVTEAHFLDNAEDDERTPYFHKGMVTLFWKLSLFAREPTPIKGFPFPPGEDQKPLGAAATLQRREMLHHDPPHPLMKAILEGKLTEELLNIGYGDDLAEKSYLAHSGVNRLKADFQHLEGLPPFPQGVLPLLTLKRLPNLTSLALNPWHFGTDKSLTEFCSSEGSVALLRQIERFDFEVKIDASDLDEEDGGERKQRYGSGGCGVFLTKKLGTCDFKCTGARKLMNCFVGGRLVELNLDSIPKLEVAGYLNQITTTVAPQLIRLSLRATPNYLKDYKNDGTEEAAVCELLSKCANLEIIELHLGHYESEPTYDVVCTELAKSCPKMTRIEQMPCLSVAGLSTIVKTLGHQLVSLGGRFLWDESNLAGAVKLVADHCPLVEKIPEFSTYGTGGHHMEVGDEIVLLSQKCQNLKFLDWKVEKMSHFTKVAQNLSHSLVNIDLSIHEAIEDLVDAQLANDMAMHLPQLEQFELNSHRHDYSVGYRDAVPPIQDNFLVELVRAKAFPKLSFFRVYFLKGVSIEAFLYLVTQGFPNLEDATLMRAHKTVVVGESKHPTVVNARGQEKIIPTWETHPKLTSLSLPGDDDDDDSSSSEDDAEITTSEDGDDDDDSSSKIAARSEDEGEDQDNDATKRMNAVATKKERKKQNVIEIEGWEIGKLCKHFTTKE